MVDARTAMKVMEIARQEKSNHKPGHLFRVPGFPGVFSDGDRWVIDVNDRGSDWHFDPDTMEQERRRWPE